MRKQRNHSEAGSTGLKYGWAFQAPQFHARKKLEQGILTKSIGCVQLDKLFNLEIFADNNLTARKLVIAETAIKGLKSDEIDFNSRLPTPLN